jgi:DnaJ like chaperone protein
MSFWSRLLKTASRLFVDDELSDERLPAVPFSECKPDPEDGDFTAAVVGLAAKMAGADGRATRSEAQAFRAAFEIAPEDKQSVDRLFALAQESVHGFEAYARRIGKRYRAKPCLLEDVLDILFHIASADGAITPDERAYLARVAELFGFTHTEWRRIEAGHMGIAANDPYAVLGLEPDAEDTAIRSAWRRLVADNHPDRLIARGAPAEFLRVAHDKTAALNTAYAQIRQERGEMLSIA